MACRVTSMTSLTPTGTANAADLVDATYPFLLRGGTATQRNKIYEIYLGGLAVVTSPTLMKLALSSIVGTGTNSLSTGQKDAPVDTSTAALAAPALVGNTNATLKPQRSTSLHLHDLSFNAWGGFVLRQFPPGQEPVIIGASANTGEVTVSANTGGTPGLLGGNMVYESL